VPRGDYRQTIKCAEQPCPEKVTYHHQTRADEAASLKSQQESPWKCTRHSRPDEVLGRGRETLAGVMTVTFRPEARSWEPSLIWTGPGFPFVSDEISGPGFRAFAGDWPEGTRLEITARILPPLETGEEAPNAAPPGSVTEWALAYTHRPTGLPGLPARRVVQPYPDEQSARAAVAAVRAEAPEDEPGLMCREVGPWTPVAGEEGSSG
jgi:hypothetical protein